MKNYNQVVRSIKTLSLVVGLPQHYDSDLDITYDELKSYDGERFVLILREYGAWTTLLDNQTDEYINLHLQYLKNYYAEYRDAQFYYYDGSSLRAADPYKVIKMVQNGDDDLDDLRSKMTHSLKHDVNSIDKAIHITWTSDDVTELIKRQPYEINPDPTPREIAQILDNLKDHHDAWVGINWSIIDEEVRRFFGDRVKNY